MELEVWRFSSQEDSTNGVLFDVTGGKRRFLCYTLEDEHREEKVAGETRIPAGTYRITLRTVGGFHGRYEKKYGEMHKGMLWVRDVPGFEYILIHTGNTDEHTAGCLLLGDSQQANFGSSNGMVGSSVNAYKRVYPPIAKALEEGKSVSITYRNFDYVG
jgi:hypothetical protein